MQAWLIKSLTTDDQHNLQPSRFPQNEYMGLKAQPSHVTCSPSKLSTSLQELPDYSRRCSYHSRKEVCVRN